MNWWRKLFGGQAQEVRGQRKKTPAPQAPAPPRSSAAAMDAFEHALRTTRAVQSGTTAYASSDYSRLLEAMIIAYMAWGARKQWPGIDLHAALKRWLPEELCVPFVARDGDFINTFRAEMESRGRHQINNSGDLKGHYLLLSKGISQSGGRSPFLEPTDAPTSGDDRARPTPAEDLSQQRPHELKAKSVEAECARHPVVLPITINLLSIVTWIVLARQIGLTMPPFDPVQLGVMFVLGVAITMFLVSSIVIAKRPRLGTGLMIAAGVVTIPIGLVALFVGIYTRRRARREDGGTR